MTEPAATTIGGNTVMLRTYVRVTVVCDTAGCESRAERTLAHGEPRALLAAVRRSLRRRDGWALSSKIRWIGPYQDLCPSCQAPALPEVATPGQAAVAQELTLTDQLLGEQDHAGDDTMILAPSATVVFPAGEPSASRVGVRTTTAPASAMTPRAAAALSLCTAEPVPDTIPPEMLTPRQ